MRLEKHIFVLKKILFGENIIKTFQLEFLKQGKILRKMKFVLICFFLTKIRYIDLFGWNRMKLTTLISHLALN